MRQIYFLFACIALFGFGSISTSGQSDRPVIRLGVEEVRLDAVVLDRKGRQVTDLTMDDFELRQGGANQKLTSAIYINEYKDQPKIQQSKTAKIMPPSESGPLLTQKEVGRTFAFVVDNIRMDFLQFCNARIALKKFVQNQMQQGDMVAIVPTFSGSSESQTFSSSKQHLLSIIDSLPWMQSLGFTRTAIAEADAQINQGSSLGALPGLNRFYGDEDLKDEQFMATAYCIKALKDVPGRKSLILISTGVWIEQDIQGMYLQMLKFYNELADAALRAGVVVHTMDLAQLAGPEQVIEDFGAEKSSSGGIPAFNPYRNVTSPDAAAVAEQNWRKTQAISSKLMQLNSRLQVPLSEKTGGLFIADSNFSSSPSGIGRASEMIKGYYLLTYVPPANTFSKNTKNSYATIQIKVKRSGCKVHTRNGFFREPASSNSPYENVRTLHEAIYSPFRYNDLKVDIVSGYVEDPQKGYLLKSFLHVDGKDLNISKAKEGKHSISLEGVFTFSNIDNVIQDSSAQRYSYSFSSADIPWIKEHGLRFAIQQPVNKSGAYYVRTAMKDSGSGKIGSAYQFVQIPDLKKSRLALSSLFVVHRDEDLPWISQDCSELSPDIGKGAGKSAAVQIYALGDVIDYAAIIYCTYSDGNIKPDLASQYVLYRDGKEFFRSNAEAVDLSGVILIDFNRIPIRKKLVLDKSLQPGDYLLELQVSDRTVKAKDKSVASQAFAFKIQ